MGRIRSYRDEDASEVAGMFGRVWPHPKSAPSTELTHYFRSLFFDPLWHDAEIPSLVYEQDGRVVGFIGVLVRRMTFQKRPVRIAISFHYMVDPEWRSALAGVELLRALFNGKQDLTLSDGGGPQGHKVWNVLGGQTSMLHSLHWVRPLRPFAWAAQVMGARRGLRAAAAATRLLGACGDAAAVRLPASHFRLRPQPPGEDLTADLILEHLPRFSEPFALGPDYDRSRLLWVLDAFARLAPPGTFRRILVRGDNGDVLGWYMYYLRENGVSELIQIAGGTKTAGKLIEHFFADAWRQGSLAVVGRMEPRLLETLSQRHSLFRFTGPWTLIQSKRPELLAAFHRGDVFFSRLEGEWCFRFAGVTAADARIG